MHHHKMFPICAETTVPSIIIEGKVDCFFFLPLACMCENLSLSLKNTLTCATYKLTSEVSK